VWAHIFTLYLLADTTVTHKLLACGLEKCLTFKDDSTTVFTTDITTVNESASQLDNMPPMSITDIYALVTLMGLHMSSSDRHEKAYRELIAYVDEGNAITLEKVQQMGLKYSCSLHPVASLSHTFTLTSEDTDEVCNHIRPRYCYTLYTLLTARPALLAPPTMTAAPAITALFARPWTSQLEIRSWRIRVST